MKNKKLIISLFIVVALVQLYIPAKMIFDSEKVLKTGIPYKFKVAPVDPNDPFRGKYIDLRYEENFIEVTNKNDWIKDEIVYVLLKKDTKGFAKIESISKEKPKNTADFVKATVDFVSRNKSNKVYIEYPFNRYYMEESKAYDAELTFNEAVRDPVIHETYALVYIKNGESVLHDVLIDKVSIKDIVEKRNN